MTSDDVQGEVQRILTHNTVDQCIQYNQTIKRDIAAAQEELRDVIGQRYRDLLKACDRVVGMEHVCKSIEESHRHTSEALKHRPSQLQAHGTGESLSMPSQVSSAASRTSMPSPQPYQRSEFCVLSEAQEMLRSARRLSQRGIFSEAAQCFLQFSRALADFDHDIGSATTTTFSTVVSVLRTRARGFPDEFHNAIKMAVASPTAPPKTLETKPGDAPPAHTDSYELSSAELNRRVASLSDMHAGLELLHGSTPGSALERLIAIHGEALSWIADDALQQGGAGTAAASAAATRSSSDRAVLAIALVRNVLTVLAHYVELRSNPTAAGLVPLTSDGDSTAMTLRQLSQLDPAHAERYADTVLVQLCGHRVGGTRRFSKTTSFHRGSEGWALSPSSGQAPPIPVPRELLENLQDRGHRLIQALLTNARVATKIHMDILRLQLGSSRSSSVSAGTSDAVQRVLDPTAWANALRGAVTQALQQAMTIAADEATSAAKSSSALVLKALDRKQKDRGAATAAASTLAGSDASAQLQRSELVRLILKCTAASSERQATSCGLGDAADAGEEAAPLVRMMQIVIQASGGDATLSLFRDGIHRVNDVIRSRLQNNDKEGLSAVCQHVLQTLDTVVRAVPEAVPVLESTLATTEACYIRCYEEWIGECCGEFEAKAMEAYRRLSPVQRTPAAAKAHLANTWQVEVVEEETKVRYPCAFTPGLSRPLFAAVRSCHEAAKESSGSSAAHANVVEDVRPSLRIAFGRAMLAAHVSAIRKILLLECPAESSSVEQNSRHEVCEDIWLQCIFDLLLAKRLLCGSANSSDQGSNGGVDAAILREMEDRVDVVTWSVTQALLRRAVEHAAQSTSLALSLFPAAAQPSSGSSATTAGSTSATCTVVIDGESDRLPLLPITTPTQVRNVVSSLQGLSSDHQASLGGNKLQGSKPAATSSTQATTATAASLWSATSKLRNVAALWGQ